MNGFSYGTYNDMLSKRKGESLHEAMEHQAVEDQQSRMQAMRAHPQETRMEDAELRSILQDAHEPQQYPSSSSKRGAPSGHSMSGRATDDWSHS